jgi:hypothetical protein
MRKNKQLNFDLTNENLGRKFGGAYLKNSNAKKKRPITTDRAMHLVMRSTLAKGPLSLRHKQEKVFAIVSKQAKTAGVKLYRYANAGNHLHMVVLPRSRPAFRKFVRAISGLIAREILGAQRGKAKGKKFWDKRPFTQIIEWGRQFRQVSSYVLQNTLEAIGFVEYKPRNKKKLKSTA